MQKRGGWRGDPRATLSFDVVDLQPDLLRGDHDGRRRELFFTSSIGLFFIVCKRGLLADAKEAVWLIIRSELTAHRCRLRARA